MGFRNNGPSEQWAVGIMTWPRPILLFYILGFFLVSVWWWLSSYSFQHKQCRGLISQVLRQFLIFCLDKLLSGDLLGTDHLTSRGAMVFFSFRNFFSDNTRVRILFQNLTLGYMTKTLNQIIFFIAPPPPWKLNGSSLRCFYFWLALVQVVNKWSSRMSLK